MKKIINKLISIFGYTFIKIHPTKLFKRDELVRVYDFRILMPYFNPLIITYNQQKNFASELGRIASLVFSKYPSLKILDIGANVGDTAATIKTSIDVPILCIEGDTFTYSYLIKNIAQFKNVTGINTYLGEKEETMNVLINKAGWNTTLVPTSSNANKVQIQTLDNIVNNLANKQDFKFLKIDTEGFDTIILRGATNFIKEINPIIYLEYNRDNMQDINEDGLPTILDLQQLGYNDILFFDDRGRFITSTVLTDVKTITHLHHYADGKNGLVYYYNLCIFHGNDKDLARELIAKETDYNIN